jgi:hypothetical protein
MADSAGQHALRIRSLMTSHHWHEAAEKNTRGILPFREVDGDQVEIDERLLAKC